MEKFPRLRMEVRVCFDEKSRPAKTIAKKQRVGEVVACGETRVACVIEVSGGFGGVMHDGTPAKPTDPTVPPPSKAPNSTKTPPLFTSAQSNVVVRGADSVVVGGAKPRQPKNLESATIW